MMKIINWFLTLLVRVYWFTLVLVWFLLRNWTSSVVRESYRCWTHNSQPQVTILEEARLSPITMLPLSHESVGVNAFNFEGEPE